MSLQTWVALPDHPGLYRLAASVERGDGKPMPRSWSCRQPKCASGASGGPSYCQRRNRSPAAGQTVQVTVSVEDAGTLPWTFDEVGPRLGEDDVTALTQLEAAWVDAAGNSRPAMVPLLLASTTGQAQDVPLTLLAPRLPGDYTLVFDVRDGSRARCSDLRTRGMHCRWS